MSIFDKIWELDQEDPTHTCLDFPAEGSHWPADVEYPTLAFICWIQGFDPRKILVDSIAKKSTNAKKLQPAEKRLQFAAEALVRVGKKTIGKTLADETPSTEALWWNNLSDTDRSEVFQRVVFEDEAIQWIAQRKRRAFRASYGQPTEFDSKMFDEEGIPKLLKNTFRACHAQPKEPVKEREEVDEETIAKLEKNIFRACYA